MKAWDQSYVYESDSAWTLGYDVKKSREISRLQKEKGVLGEGGRGENAPLG